MSTAGAVAQIWVIASLMLFAFGKPSYGVTALFMSVTVSIAGLFM